MLVHGSPLSQPTRMVLWTCKLLNIPYDFKRVDAGKGEQKSPEFLKLNPNAVFPVLTEGTFVLWESNAICRYLCSKSVANDLYPSSNTQLRAQIDQWLDWKHGALREGCAGTVRRKVLKNLTGKGHSMFQTFEEVKEERELRLMLSALSVLEAQLGTTKQFLVHGQVTLADLAVFEEVEQLSLLPNTEELAKGGAVLSKQFPNIVAWQAQMRKLPYYSEVHKELLGAAKKLEEGRKSKL